MFDETGGSISGLQLLDDVPLVQRHVLRQIATCDFRYRFSSFSRFSRSIHLSSFVPCLGNANYSSKRRSNNLNGDREDSRNGMSSSATGLK